jgi:beta-fructofuranosidase
MPSRRSILTAFGSLLTLGYAQESSNSSTSTYSQANVPTGTPLPGNYDEPLRPQVHFSPPVGFMNDPNGMFVDEDGLYHLYYQCA